MVLDVSVTDRKPDATGRRALCPLPRRGQLKRSEFGMAKFVDVVGDTVDISIRTDAWR